MLHCRQWLSPIRDLALAPDKGHAVDQILVLVLAVARLLGRVVVLDLVQERDVARALTLVVDRVVALVRVVVLLLAHVLDVEQKPISHEVKSIVQTMQTLK